MPELFTPMWWVMIGGLVAVIAILIIVRKKQKS